MSDSGQTHWFGDSCTGGHPKSVTVSATVLQDIYELALEAKSRAEATLVMYVGREAMSGAASARCELDEADRVLAWVKEIP